MKLVLTTVDAIPEWLYPGSFKDIKTPPAGTLHWRHSSLDSLQAL
ncbi:MAG: hypothetical protein P1V97_10460 [Planctomycetota bacterium]|nr:hypothetical protein [Planctomycetota bacterium]